MGRVWGTEGEGLLRGGFLCCGIWGREGMKRFGGEG